MNEEKLQYFEDVVVIGTLHAVRHPSQASSSPHLDKKPNHRCAYRVALEVPLPDRRLDANELLLYLILSDGENLIAAPPVLLGVGIILYFIPLKQCF